MPLLRGREGAFFVAEQRALQQRLRQRAAVHRDERAPRATAAPMQKLREHLLAASGLSREKHRGLVRRDQRGAVKESLHRGALGDGLSALLGEALSQVALLFVRFLGERGYLPDDPVGLKPQIEQTHERALKLRVAQRFGPRALHRNLGVVEL